MGRKTIGVFAGQIEMPAQREVLLGIAREAKKFNMNVAVFSSLIQEGGPEGFQNGEVLVFDIANLDKLDAIIVFPETLRIKPDLLDKLCDRIRRVPKIVKVSYDREIEGFVPFLCNDISPSKSIVEHLINQHGCRDIYYVTGKEGHPHSMARLEGYRQALTSNGIEYDESKVFYGDFWYYMGDEIVSRILENKPNLPDAIACANEPMAISVCEALQRRDIKVPEQVLVTGFDHSGDGIHRPDYVTSVRREEEEKGHEMVRYISSVIEGIGGYEPFQRNSTKIYVGETCGCDFEVKKISAVAHTEEANFFSLYNFMNESLFASQTVTEFLTEIEHALTWMSPLKSFNIVITEKCYSGNGESVKRDSFLGNERCIQCYRVENGRADSEEEEHRIDMTRRFDKGEMLPQLWDENRGPEVYIFNVLHFNEEIFGYTVLTYNDEPYCYDTNYPFWLKNVNNACESMRRLTSVRYLYHEAERKSITDTMTGLYNRNGFNRMITEKIADMTADDVMILMEFDNNNLKKVNDRYGHEAGDEMILLSTQAIEKARVQGAAYEANFRIGGDEYVKLAIGHIDANGAEKAQEEVEQFLENITYVLDRPYPISMACGYSVYKRMDIHSVDEIMKVADEKMYIKKIEMKQQLEEV